MSAARDRVVWHDLECGHYREDLRLWRSLAADQGDPVLDIGAGTGRVALELARAGHRVTALDRDRALIKELTLRSEGLKLDTLIADARQFELQSQFPLCIVPMQTIQLLEGAVGRAGLLQCTRRHLRAEGLLAVAIAETLDSYEVTNGVPAPLPDVGELDGSTYTSQPTAVRITPRHWVLERRREITTANRTRRVERNVIRLDRLTVEQLCREASAVGLRYAGHTAIAATPEYTGSEVVMLRA